MLVGMEDLYGKEVVLYSRVSVGTVTRKYIILSPPFSSKKKNTTVLTHLQIKFIFFHKCLFPLAILNYPFLCYTMLHIL